MAGLGIPLYGIRETAKARDNLADRSIIFFEIFLIRLFTTVILLVPYFIMVINIKRFNNDLLLYYWGAVYIVANMGSIDWFFTGLEDFKYITSRSLIVKVLSVILMFIIVKHKGDVLNYFLVTIFILVINGFIDLRYALKYLTFKIDWRGLHFKRHLKPLFYIFSSLLAIKVYTLVDTIILGFLSTNQSVGYYNSAIKLVRISLTVITSLGTVLIARLSNAVNKNDFDEYNQLIALAVPKEQRFPMVWRNAPDHKDNFGAITRQPTHFVINSKNEFIFKREGSFEAEDWDNLWTSLKNPSSG